MSKDKLSQHARRQVTRFVREQFTVINRVMRDKPKYLPMWIWSPLVRLVIDVDLLARYANEGVESFEQYAKRTKETK